MALLHCELATAMLHCNVVSQGSSIVNMLHSVLLLVA